MSNAAAANKPKPRPRRRRRVNLLRFIVVCGAVCVALLIGELIVLVSGVNRDFHTLRTSTIVPRAGGPFEMLPSGFVPYATVRCQYATNPRGYFDKSSGIDHVFNSEGWRDEEHPVEKPDGVFRILALGDSYVYGQGVRQEDLCTTRLAEALTKQYPQRRFETINAAQSGYNTVMEQRQFERRGVDFQPDLVLLGFVPNDVESDIYTDKPKVEFFTEFTAAYVEPDWLSQYSELWMLARRKVMYQAAGQRYLQRSIDSFLNEPEKWDDCGKALEGIRDLSKANGIRFAVVIFPFFVGLSGDYPFQPIHDHVRAFCDDASIPVLDLRDTYRNFDGPELWVHPTDQHPNEQAHRIAGDAIASFLHESRLIDVDK